MAICLPCIGLDCVQVDDLAAGIDSALYSQLDYSFIIDCPPKCYCPPGLFPQTISILASVIPPIVPPIVEPGFPIILRLQGCTSLITRTLPETATQTELATAAQSMQAEWAGQQALCNALETPGVNCSGSGASTLKVCNDEQIGWCGDVTPECTYSQTLVTSGMTQSQIDAAVALIKNNLNIIAQQTNCGGWLCPITLVRTSTGGNSEQDILIQNVGPKTVDLSGLEFCIDNPPGTCGPGSFSSIAPHTGPLAWGGGLSPISVPWRLRYYGHIIYTGQTPIGFLDGVTAVVGCFDV